MFFQSRPSPANGRFAKLFALLGVLLLAIVDARAQISAVYGSAMDVPVTVPGNYTAAGSTVSFTLNFAPPVGTNLTVVKLTGFGVINGTFTNLAQNQRVALTRAGQVYDFVANYYGGTGNDLVLQWADTRAMAWGLNADGRLGSGDTMQGNLPVAVSKSGVLGGKTIVALSAGRNHSVGLCSDGTVAAWGANFSSQIGANGGAQSTVPVIVSNLGVLSIKRVIAVAAGEVHNLALCSDGTVAAWGENGGGRLGNNSTTTTGTPVTVSTSGVLSGKKVVAIAAGQDHSLALLSNGTVAAWGDNSSGQLGNGTTTGSTVPVLVNTGGVLSGKTVSAIAAGDGFSLALCSDGTLAAWGGNKDGQLGNGTSGTSTNSLPVAVTTAGTFLSGKTVTSIAAGASHSLALCSDGTVAAWGYGAGGQLGNGSVASSSLAVAVDTTGALSGKTVTSIGGATGHSVARCTDGTVAAWGRNSYGELGTGNNAPSTVPQQVNATPLLVGERFMQVTAGPMGYHSLAIVASPPAPGSLTYGTLISNGSFESGFRNWSVSDINSPYRPLAVRSNNYNPGSGFFRTAATDGDFSASSGFEGAAPGIVRMAHDVPVTASEPFLRFDWRAAWDLLGYSPSLPSRQFAVTIEPAGGGTVMQRTIILTVPSGTRNLDNGAQSGAVDLSAFIGTTVRVCFDLTVPEPSPGHAFFQLDNVRTAALLPASVNPITGAATGITRLTATLNGIGNANGTSATVVFEYGTTVSYGNSVITSPTHIVGSTDTPVSAALTGLLPNTTYHYRIKTTSATGVKYGADATFTTLPHAPAVISYGTSDLTRTSANFYAEVNPNNSSTVVTFEYGLTPDCTSSAPVWQGPVTTPGSAVHAQVSGLTSGATYYFRVRAQNAGGVTVTDPPSPLLLDPALADDPAVNTLPPTMVSRFSAQLEGMVNAPNGTSANVDFQFGTTTQYFYGTGAFPSTVTHGTDIAVSGTIGGLTAGTTYHYRTRAIGPNGDVYGPDVTFTTPAIGFPAASTDTATGITQMHATLRGFASANGGPQTTVSFEYGPDTNYGTTVILPGFAAANSFGQMQTQIPVTGDSVIYHYRIKATNNIGTTYGQDMTFTTPDPHEARLYELTFGSGALSPAFERNVTTYTMSLSFEATSLWLTPTASTGIGAVTVNGTTVTSGGNSEPIALHIGSNVISIVVTALDGTTQQTYTVTVTRSAPVAGDLDFSFNGTGRVINDLPTGWGNAEAVAVQNDGRILVAGYASNAPWNFALARFNPDGTPDTTFGGTGIVLSDLGSGGDLGHCLALQSDGKIVVAGQGYYGSDNAFAVARFNADGTLDTSFNGTGKVITPVGARDAICNAVTLQGDGKILAAGYASNGSDYDFAIVRYNSNGTLDTSFGTAGKVVTPVGTVHDFIRSVALQTDGKIVVAGSAVIGGNEHFAVARYHGDAATGSPGTLDTTFNGTGIVSTSIGVSYDNATGVAVQSDGKIVAAGYADNGTDTDFALARYHSNGSLDTGFGGTGKIITPIGTGTGDDSIFGIALQSDGKIVAAGRSYDHINPFACVVVRYGTDGSLDTTFKGTGKAIVDIASGDDEVSGVALQDDGKIVVAASVAGDFAVARLLSDGPAIAVQAAPGTNVFDGISTVQFPGALPGASTSITFTIQNTGTAGLTGLGTSIDGTDNPAFTVTGSPTAPVSPFGTTTFTVRFLPTSLGPKTATLHIASNVTGHTQSYDIALAGAGLTVLENWRQQFLGTANNTGDAADDADPFHTGIQNLAVFAFLGPGQNPATALLSQLPQAQLTGGNLTFSFMQPDGVSGITYGAEWRPDLATGDWMPVLPDTGSGGVHIFTVPIGSYPSLFMRLKVTRP